MWNIKSPPFTNSITKKRRSWSKAIPDTIISGKILIVFLFLSPNLIFFKKKSLRIERAAKTAKYLEFYLHRPNCLVFDQPNSILELDIGNLGLLPLQPQFRLSAMHSELVLTKRGQVSCFIENNSLFEMPLEVWPLFERGFYLNSYQMQVWFKEGRTNGGSQPASQLVAFGQKTKQAYQWWGSPLCKVNCFIFLF